MNGGGKAIYAHGTSSARGIAMFCSKEVFVKISNICKSEDGRWIIVDLTEGSTTVTIVAVYAPNQDLPEFFKSIEKILCTRQEHKIIIGDFNLTLDVEMDRQNTYHNNNKAKEEIENIMDQYCLSDIWRVRNPEKKEYSWFKRGNILKASRIDLALVSGGLDQKVEMVHYLSSIKTDHRAMYVVVDLHQFERGTGYWKFNNTLLQDLTFLQVMNEELDLTICSSEHMDSLARWEMIKERIQKVSKEFSRKNTSESKLVIEQLSEAVNDFESRLPLNEEENTLWLNTKLDLEEKLFEKVKGSIFRSKVKWYEEGETNSKYFYALEKARYNSKTCITILEGEQEISNPFQILQLQRNFYSDLYSVDKEVEFTMENIFGIKVPRDVKADQDEQISMSEIEMAIKKMNNNKTPGQDGLPVDFYKVFWTKLKQPFYDMVIASFERENLHSTARKGILNLIPKAGKDTRIIKNLRPITLLNTDYKIIEKAIAEKMLPALEHIIHPDQRGFMKERRISVNIRKMLDIIHQANKSDLEAVIMSLDFVKCFDKCSYLILHGSLDFFGFGSIVKAWTKILYKDFTVQIQNNGYFSEPIQIEKGVHQGGCCSSLYFLVIAEILALSLRASEDIEGISFRDIRNLLNQFADDMDIFSLCKKKSIQSIHDILEYFRLQSGFTVSYEKTTLYRIGSLRHSDAELYGMSHYVWSNQDIKVLGVTIAHQDLVSKNYEDTLTKVKSTLNRWYNRNLSLFGKIQVVNTLIASLFVYKMMVLPCIPKVVVSRADNMIREYIWGGKKAKIAFGILQNPKCEGGLNLVNLRNKDMALKATWPKILAGEKEYARMVYSLMRVPALGQNIWRCNIAPEDVMELGIKVTFWEDVLFSWAKYNYYQEKVVENQIIWCNSMIKVGKKIIRWGDVMAKGLLYVFQLFEEGKFKSSQAVWEDFGLTQLRFNSLKAAIPKQWKEFFMNTPRSIFLPIRPCVLDYSLFVSNFSQKVYRSLSDDILLVHHKYLKWRQELGPQYQDGLVDFGRSHRDIFKVTNVAKYRSFHYRLIQRALVTNVLLFKWGLAQSSDCYFCNQYVETIIHLFWECPTIQDMWQEMRVFLEQYFKVELNLTATNVIFNQVVERRMHVVNFIVLVIKQYVYKQRCLKLSICVPELIQNIKRVENIEKFIAVKNGKIDVHKRKWLKF